MGVILPRGAAGRRHAAADPVAEHDLRRAVGGVGRSGRRPRGDRPGRRPARVLVRGGVRPHRHPREPAAESMGTSWWDTVATLGWLAGITEHVRLLSHVYVPAYRHPLQVAKAFSTLDNVSGRAGRARRRRRPRRGRVRPARPRRSTAAGRLLDEAIDALRAAFADEYPAVEGPTWTFDGYGQRPRPVQAGGPPIWVGGSSKPALRRAATRGDGWLPQGPVTPEPGRRRSGRSGPRPGLPDAVRHRRHRRRRCTSASPTGTSAARASRPAREGGPHPAQARRARRRPGAGPAPVALARRAARPDRGDRHQVMPAARRLTDRRHASTRTVPAAGPTQGPLHAAGRKGRHRVGHRARAWDATSRWRSPERAPTSCSAARTRSRARRRGRGGRGARPAGAADRVRRRPTEASCRALADRAAAELGRVDILVNNAFHGGDAKSLMDADLADWRQTHRHQPVRRART